MPHYEISHTTPLSATQRTHLASAITTLHCTTFSAASIFVNITFHDHHHHEKAKQTGYTKTTFVGGKEAPHTNTITAHLRPRPATPTTRTKHLDLLSGLTTHWNAIVQPTRPGWLSDARALDSVFIMGDMDAAAEQGFVVPQAGAEGDGEWVEGNMGAFRERVEAGDTGLVGLVKGRL